MSLRAAPGVEKAVSKVPGFLPCSVSPLTNPWAWKDSGQADIVAAVEEAGYGAAPKARGEGKGRFRDIGGG